MVKKVNIKIDKTGKVELDVQNAVGNECEKWTEMLENALGEVKQRELKDSYYEENTQSEEYSAD
ncbi:MAG: DUF2997 domain-containing protein [Halobacteriovoraceae bacterium]|nr:DUF2997 domain-containing protein [Halobacteriovoraceae bacterium]